MIKKLNFSDRTLNELKVPDIAHRILARRMVPEKKPVDFDIHFEVWTVSYKDVTKYVETHRTDSSSEPDLEKDAISRNSGQVHHQIVMDNKKIACGLSKMTKKASEEPDLRLQALFISGIASEINSKYKWIQETIKDEDITVRLLEAPEYKVTAFWIVSESDRILPIESPPEFDEYFTPKDKKPITPMEFLTALIKVGTITGIVWKQDI